MEKLLEMLIDLIGQEIPVLHTVDEDYGQLEGIDQESRDEYPLIFPAVLINIGDTSWQDLGDLNQRGITNVTIKLCIDCYDDTHYGSGTTAKIAERESLRKELHCLLHGKDYRGQKLMRTNSRSYTAVHGIKVYESVYSVAVSEYIADNKQKVKPHIKIVSTEC